MLRKKTGIIILNYNSYNDTVNCINSIFNFSNKKSFFKIYIVDNASTDESGSTLTKKYEDYNNISIILNSKNTGYARGNNIGIQATLKDGCEYILIINNDTLFNNNVCEKLTDFMSSHPLIGVVAPKILTKDGNVQPGVIKKSDVFNDKNPNVILRKMFPKITEKISESSCMSNYNSNLPFKCFKVLGCAWMIRRSTFEKVGFYISRKTYIHIYSKKIISRYGFIQKLRLYI